MIIKDKEKIAEVCERGVEAIYPQKEFLEKKLLSGERLKIYCGFDPSAPALHIGNAIQLNKLAQFQALGHEVIFLIGDFTGMIGDPTDKLSVRKKLTREQVLENSKKWQEQASTYLDFTGDNPAVIRYNSEWQDKVSFLDLIELSSHFTVQQMLQRDMFQERIKQEKPIYFHEFLYPLAQAYDSVVLDVDLEIGGNDQMFNMLAGRDLMKALGKKEKSVLTLKLLADAGGVKMGKTTGNALFLDQEPKDLYGVIMSWPDEIIIPAFELATKLPWQEIKKYAQELEQGVNPRDLKMKLALEITTIIVGAEKAQEAEKYFQSTIQNKEQPTDIVQKEVSANLNIIDALYQVLAEKKSKSEIRRLIAQGGVSKDNQKIISGTEKIQPGVYKVGKRDWFAIKIK